MKLKKALLVVDVQNDFCPGGTLAVPQGDEIVPVLNKYIKLFSKKKLPVFLSRDWHPPKTSHFKKFGGVWPVHCVQKTQGAQFHPKLKVPKEAILLYKGMDPNHDSYSVFQAADAYGMSFANLLKILGINELYIGGLATDYCIKFSTLDALRRDLKVRILMDGIRGVDLKPGDSEKAIQQMFKEGAEKIILADTKV